MITMEIVGTMPTMEGFGFAGGLERGARMMEISIKTNFAEGGRPTKWQAKKDGSPSNLFAGGRLYNTISSGFSDVEAWAGVPEADILDYSFVHQFGYDGVKKNGVYMLMPQRQYILFQEEDLEALKQELINDIVTFWDTQGEEV